MHAVRTGGLSRFFWAYCLVLLGGYAFLGKGLAYVGAFPILVAEIGLVIGVTALAGQILRRGFPLFFRTLPAEVYLLAPFVLWNAIRTVPFIRSYGLDAARDATLWGYSAYALIILVLVPKAKVYKFVSIYRAAIPYYLLWLPIAFLLTKLRPLNLGFPGAPVPIVWLKSGDVGVHLAGVLGLMLLWPHVEGSTREKLRSWLLWFLWAGAWIAFGSGSRGAMLSGLVGLVIVIIFRPKSAWYRPLISLLALLGLLYLSSFRLTITQYEEVSFRQLALNVGSILDQSLLRTETADSNSAIDIQSEGAIDASGLRRFDGDVPIEPVGQLRDPSFRYIDEVSRDRSPNPLRGTLKFRLDWWSEILSYTITGPYKWAGKGYGVNLADDDGFQVYEDHSLRSPHNVFMTVLARAGVIGLTTWLLFLGGLAFSLLRTVRAPNAKTTSLSAPLIAIWLMAYLGAFLVNAAFDVFLEGPMGGVWFWSLVGISLVMSAGARFMSNREALEKPTA